MGDLMTVGLLAIDAVLVVAWLGACRRPYRPDAALSRAEQQAVGSINVAMTTAALVLLFDGMQRYEASMPLCIGATPVAPYVAQVVLVGILARSLIFRRRHCDS